MIFVVVMSCLLCFCLVVLSSCSLLSESFLMLKSVIWIDVVVLFLFLELGVLGV